MATFSINIYRTSYGRDVQLRGTYRWIDDHGTHETSLFELTQRDVPEQDADQFLLNALVDIKHAVEARSAEPAKS